MGWNRKKFRGAPCGKPGEGRRILAAGAAVQLFTGIPAAWGVFQRPVMEEYAFTRTQATFVFTLLVVFYGIGCVLGGYLQDARGPRTAALLGAALLGGGFMAAAFCPAGAPGWFYLLFSVPAGLGSAFLCPSVLACAQKWYAGHKGLATGVAGVSMGLSGAFFTAFVTFVGGALGMRMCMGALGAVMLLVGGVGASVLRDPPAAQASPGGVVDYPPRKMMRTPQYRLCVAAVALSAPPVLLFSPEILQIAQDRGVPGGMTGWCVVFGSAASAAGRLACPAAGDRLGRKRVLLALCGGLALGSAGFAFAKGWWVAAAYAALTFCYSGAAAVQPSLNSDLFGLPHAGVNYGFLALGMSAGSLLSYAGSQLLDQGLRHWLAAGCAAAGALCYLALRPTGGPNDAVQKL
ncbi:MAG: MFS transporter [Gemmiger sp.]